MYERSAVCFSHSKDRNLFASYFVSLKNELQYLFPVPLRVAKPLVLLRTIYASNVIWVSLFFYWMLY